MSSESTRSDNNGETGLSLFSLVCLVVASMIGWGVFTTSGFSLADLGSGKQVLTAWTLGGLWAICGAIGYGALARRVPLSGGEYLYLSRFVHPSVGFLTGWISLIAGFTTPIASAAKTLAVYALPSYADTSWQNNILASVVIIVAAAIHAAGLHHGARAQNFGVIAKLILLSIFCTWAFFGTSPESWHSGVASNADGSVRTTDDIWIPATALQWQSIMGALVWITLSYTGFNAAVYVAGESRKAASNVPSAMALAASVVTIFYILLNYIFLYGGNPNDLAGAKDVASVAANSLGGPVASSAMRAIVILCVGTSVFAMVMTGPRVYAQMATDGFLPKVFLPTATQGGTIRPAVPIRGILIQALVSMIVVWFSDLKSLLEYLGLTLSVSAALTVSSLFIMRIRYPDIQRIKSWEGIPAAIFVLTTIVLIYFAAQTRSHEFWICCATYASGVTLYFAAKGLGLLRIPTEKELPVD